MARKVEGGVDFAERAAAHALRPLLGLRLSQGIYRNGNPFENSLDDDPVFHDTLKIANDHAAAANLVEPAHDNQSIARQNQFAKADLLQSAESNHVSAEQITLLCDIAAKLG